jgi:hypothetical protein
MFSAVVHEQMHERTEQNKQVRQRSQGVREMFGEEKKRRYRHKTGERDLHGERPSGAATRGGLVLQLIHTSCNVPYL